MPVTSGSRYAGLPVYNAPGPDGVSRPTVAMRLAPADPSTPAPVVYQHTVTTLETLEYLAWRVYNASDAWWRIADANPPVFPLDWRPGDFVALPVTTNKGRIDRTRRF